jgi:hypothetical protein
MKLAEALLLRADRARVLEQLRARSQAAARYQEGEAPLEDANSLLAQADAVLNELQDLIRQINRTNAATLLTGSTTLTDALAERDVLKLRHAFVNGLADAATGARGNRQLRSELRTLSAVNVPELRDQTNAIARRMRELDALIQEANWTHDLIEDQ